MWKKHCAITAATLCLLLPASASEASSATTYTMTATEMAALDSRLNLLSQEHQASAERITSSADRVESGIEQAQDGINKAADRAASSEQLIGECQQILAGIRARGEAH